MQVRWTRPASRDLEHITERIYQHNPIAARQVAKTIFDRCMGLDLFPNRGRIGRISGTRELVFAPLPYIAIYRVKQETVDILRIIHTSQNWP
jgi:addiction module RelE/StbE family toxin